MTIENLLFIAPPLQAVNPSGDRNLVSAQMAEQSIPTEVASRALGEAGI
jgi:hypothetical protein